VARPGGARTHGYSTNVTILSSYDTRQVVVIQCLDCGKTSDSDTEHGIVDTGD